MGTGIVNGVGVDTNNFQNANTDRGGSGSKHMSYGETFAKLFELFAEITDVYGGILQTQNENAEMMLGKMEKISNAKAALVKLLAAFPVPKDGDPQDPRLSELKDGYDHEALDTLKNNLKSLNMGELDAGATKSDLESLQTRLTGQGETLAGKQGMQSAKTNFYLGKIQANETANTNVIKAQGSLEMSFARNSGPV
jgi:hypothetical protein